MLQEARTAGCRTTSDANRFIEEKRKKEAEESMLLRLNHGAPGSIAGKTLKSPRGLPRNLHPFGSDSLPKVTPPRIYSGLDTWDVDGLLGADLLSETVRTIIFKLDVCHLICDFVDLLTLFLWFERLKLFFVQEKKMCNETRILAVHYLKMLDILTREIKKGQIKKKSDAYSFFKVEPSKVDRVYDMLVHKGIGDST